MPSLPLVFGSIRSGQLEFRQWAIAILRDFSIRGYVLDKERLKNGAYFTKEYFDNLLEEIREIRASERNFYQKITDIYSTAMDYNKDSEITRASLPLYRINFTLLFMVIPQLN